MSTSQSAFDRYFGITESGSNYKREIMGGTVTFAAMAYILMVNPSILSVAGLDKDGLYLATALAAAFGSLLMGILAKLPFAQAPGMGLNAFFAYTVVLGMGVTPQMALAIVFTEGCVFLALSLSGLREKLFNAFPAVLRTAISVGIGAFIAFLGLRNAGIIIGSEATMVTTSPKLLSNPTIWAFVIGLAVAIFLFVRHKGYAIPLGILAAWAAGILFQLIGWYQGDSLLPQGVMSFNFSGLENTFGTFWSGFGEIFASAESVSLFFTAFLTMLYVDMFDTFGVCFGLFELLREGNTKVDPSKKLGKALISDALATIVGAVLGTSTTTTYVESNAGVAAGARTGLAGVTTAALFLLAIPFGPLLTAVPAFATATALVMVGVMMFGTLKGIDWRRMDNVIPVFMTLLLMVLGFAVSMGLAWGVLFYLLMRVVTPKSDRLPPEPEQKSQDIVMWVLGAVFVVMQIFVM